MMVKLTDYEKEFIEKELGIPGERAETMELNFLLSLIDDWIIYYGYDKGYEFNDTGRKGQRIYDDIYYRNDT